MYHLLRQAWHRGTRTATEERGITGLETAIVLIAFVVVASVFAFAVLSTGLLSSEKSKETIVGALEETSATLIIKGTVVAVSTSTPSSINSIRFQVASATAGADPVNLATSGTHAAILSYRDSTQNVNVSTWTASWLSGNGTLLNPGETVEIDVDISAFTSALTTSTAFTIELKPTVGAVLRVERTTPSELFQVMDLQ